MAEKNYLQLISDTKGWITSYRKFRKYMVLKHMERCSTNYNEWRQIKTTLLKEAEKSGNEKDTEGDLQDGGGVRCGDHLLPHKYIRNTSTCGTTPTEHLLNAGRRLQTSQKPQEQQIKSPQSTWCTLHLWNAWIDNESSPNWGSGLWEQL